MHTAGKFVNFGWENNNLKISDSFETADRKMK